MSVFERIPPRVYDAAFGIGILAIVLFVAWTTEPVHAAPSQPDACELVATINTIQVYQCEDLDGQPFLMNSMGFISR